MNEGNKKEQGLLDNQTTVLFEIKSFTQNTDNNTSSPSYFPPLQPLTNIHPNTPPLTHTPTPTPHTHTPPLSHTPPPLTHIPHPSHTYPTPHTPPPPLTHTTHPQHPPTIFTDS